MIAGVLGSFPVYGVTFYLTYAAHVCAVHSFSEWQKESPLMSLVCMDLVRCDAHPSEGREEVICRMKSR
jgi:hypothetical protein